MPNLTRRHVLQLLLYLSLFLPFAYASSAEHGELPNSSSVSSTPTALTTVPPTPLQSISTCESRTANYITHNLPQQCLRENWTRSANGTTVATEVTEQRSNKTADVSPEDSTADGTKANDKTIESSAPALTSVSGATDATATLAVPSENQSPQSASGAETTPLLASESQIGETEAETDSPLDNAKFLSFEEWKKQNLAKIGQSPEDLGQSRASTDGRKRPAPINNALDSLGEEGEIELEFGFGSGSARSEDSSTVRSSPEAQKRERTVDESSPGAAASGPPDRRKDAGTTCKERFNYASFDCAATILKTNPQCKSSTSVLVENKDSYMLNECAADNKFLIVELCDDILIDTIVLANFEFFSSMFRTFRVSISDRYPVKMDRWKELGIFEASNSRDIQAFAVENPLIWARYLRIEFLTHYGNEYYCPVSLLRVHGTTMMEEFRNQEEPGRSDDEIEEAEPVPNRAIQPSSIDGVVEGSLAPQPVPTEDTKAASVEELEVQELNYEHSNPTMAGNLSDISPSNTTSLVQETASSVAGPSPSTRLNYTSAGNETLATNASAEETDDPSASSRANSTEPPLLLLTAATPISSATSGSSSSNSSTDDRTKTASSVLSSVSTASDDNSTSVKPTDTNPESTKSLPSPIQAPSASPTTQESFFKSIHKRLQMLESNSTLSLQYIEEQSRILRDAFKQVEKRQMGKAETFLKNLNDTVLTELQGFRQQYDQLWQSTVIELETNREQYQREMSLLSTRLTLMADELVFQKRMAVVQSTLLLLCLGLVLFVRSGSSSSALELPLMQQVMNKSHSMLQRLPFDSPSPPQSPSSRSISPPRVTKSGRRFFTAPRGQESDVSSSPLRPNGRHGEKPVIELAPATPTDGDDEAEDVLDMESPGDGLDELVVRQTKSGPATPRGSRENQNPLDWVKNEELIDGQSESPRLVNGDSAPGTNHVSPFEHAGGLLDGVSDAEDGGEGAGS